MMKVTVALLVVCLAVSASAFSLPSSPFSVNVELPEQQPLAEASGDYIPTVLMHGMGDSAHFPGMKSLAESIEKAYPGAYAVPADVANFLTSYYKSMDEQLEELTNFVRADPKLAKGFNLVGFSQGGLLAKAYATRVNNPPVRNLVSVCGTLDGIVTCPQGLPSGVCSLFNKFAYHSPTVFASYWKDLKDQNKYMTENKFLPDINNEKDTKNSTYAENIKSLDKFAMVMALNDTIVVPKESEQMGMMPWGSDWHSAKATLLRDTDAYKGDWTGLKSMDASGKLDLLEFEGNHLQFSSEFWSSKLLPYFGNKFQ